MKLEYLSRSVISELGGIFPSGKPLRSFYRSHIFRKTIWLLTRCVWGEAPGCWGVGGTIQRVSVANGTIRPILRLILLRLLNLYLSSIPFDFMLLIFDRKWKRCILCVFGLVTSLGMWYYEDTQENARWSTKPCWTKGATVACCAGQW
jgi:hypothetical protein